MLINYGKFIPLYHEVLKVTNHTYCRNFCYTDIALSNYNQRVSTHTIEIIFCISTIAYYKK